VLAKTRFGGIITKCLDTADSVAEDALFAPPWPGPCTAFAGVGDRRHCPGQGASPISWPSLRWRVYRLDEARRCTLGAAC
jgi:hypothetical protein